MEFFDFISILSSNACLYDFIKSRLTGAREEFLNELRKTVDSVCKRFEQDLKNSYEFKDIRLPQDAVKLLLDSITEALDTQMPYTKDMVLPNEKRLNSVREQLYELLSNSLLQSSFEYCMRDHVTRSKMLQTDVLTKLEEMSRVNDKCFVLLNALNTEMKVALDSAKTYSFKISISKNRFHFNKCSVDFYGRSNEIEQLKLFCDCSEEFLWWAVTGEGGTGKSRLAHEFKNIIESYGWSVCTPPAYNDKILWEVQESLPNNTLFIIDYAGRHIQEIIPWLIMISKREYPSKVRVLLLERQGKRLQDANWVAVTRDQMSAIRETIYNGSEFLRLPPINELDLCKIMQNYATLRKSSIDILAANNLLNVLKNIDNECRRPLYALFITDAYIDTGLKKGKGPLWWSREDALDYAYKKELQSLEADIRHISSNGVENLLGACQMVITMATMTGGIRYPDELEKLMPKEYEIFNNFLNSYAYRNPLEDIFILEKDVDGNFVCNPMQPDILGEYFVLKTFLDLNMSSEEQIQYIKSAWEKDVYIYSFLERLNQDFSDMIGTGNIGPVFTEAILPNHITRISPYMFLEDACLTSVIIPFSVKSIENDAFKNCARLKNVIIPPSVESIGDRAFEGCKNRELPRNCVNSNNLTKFGNTNTGFYSHAG